MSKKHTSLSLFLAMIGVGLIFAGIFLAHFLPAPASSALGSIYFIAPVAVLFWSIKSMRPADKGQPAENIKKRVIIRYMATYARFLSGLLIVGAIVIYSNNQNISLTQISYSAALLIMTFVVFVAATALTILSIFLKS